MLLDSTPENDIAERLRLWRKTALELTQKEFAEATGVHLSAGRPAMFRFDPALKVYLHREPVDGRKAINGLALLVEQALGLDPFAPALFVFSNRRRDRIKILLWERTGFWLMIKRLEADRFKWPKDAEVVTLSVEQLHWLLAGIDLAAMQPHPERKYLQAG
jgi:transposase